MVVVPTDISTNSVGGVPFLHTLSSICRLLQIVDLLMMAILAQKSCQRPGIISLIRRLPKLSWTELCPYKIMLKS